MLNQYFRFVAATHALAFASTIPMASATTALSPRPSTSELVRRYNRANELRSRFDLRAIGLHIEPHWYLKGSRFWFHWSQKGAPEYQTVDCAKGVCEPLFDPAKLTSALAQASGQALGEHPRLANLKVDEDGSSIEFDALDRSWKLSLANDRLESVQPSRSPAAAPDPGQKDPWQQDSWHPDHSILKSADGKWTAAIVGKDVIVEDASGKRKTVATGSDTDYFARLEWAPGLSTIVATRVKPGERKSYMYIEESPPGGGKPVLHKQTYDRPGDRIDTYRMELIDPSTAVVVPVKAPDVAYGDLPQLRWTRDGSKFRFEAYDRGFSRYRVFEVEARTGEYKTLIDDHPQTFVDSTSQYTEFLGDDSIVWRSERDGWAQLYHVGSDGVVKNRITNGQWVVRSVLNINESKNRIVFGASGVHAGEDPYFVHYYAAPIDGGPMVEITPEAGNHQVSLSPDGETLVDSCSTVQSPPVHRLRRVSDGALVCDLGRADISGLIKARWRGPEPFVAKGRDGKTDIYGVVWRPTDYSRNKRYPVVEDIYAGPHDSFVPKSFVAYSANQALAELGFIVVQIDGMGTRNRSKAFQDVCYKNIKDAGFPDRILWIKALAEKDPSIDLSRVGVFGTSAGGQNAAGALIFHGDFYKVAVASCGCHDNRLDKLWWNEQWMGYPVGPEYAASSNIENAAQLRGHLLLFVGEMDRNVPPESTFRLANALQRAGKDYDFLVVAGSDHTNGGTYGEHKRRDFFVRHLLGVEPPDWSNFK